MTRSNKKPCLKCGSPMPRRANTCPSCGISQDVAFFGLWDKIIFFDAGSKLEENYV